MKTATRNRQRTRKHRDEYRALRRIHRSFWGGVGMRLLAFKLARNLRAQHELMRSTGLASALDKSG